MTTTPQSMSDLPELPEPFGDFYSDDRCAELPEIYTADQMREYGRLCRATAEQAGKVEDVHGNAVKIDGEWMDYRDVKPTHPAATFDHSGCPFAVTKGGHSICQPPRRMATQPAAQGQTMIDSEFHEGHTSPRRAATQMPVAWQRNCTLKSWRGPQWQECTKTEHDLIVDLGYHTDETGFNWPSEARALFAAPVSPSREVE